MEAGDIITHPRAIMELESVYSSDTEIDEPNENIKLLKSIVTKYVAPKFTQWFEDKKDELTDEFVKYFNSYNEHLSYSFVMEYNDEFNDNLDFDNFYDNCNVLIESRNKFNVNDFIEFWIEYTKWWKEISGEIPEMKSTKQAWNCIGNWCYNNYLTNEWEELFEGKMNEQYCIAIDDNRRDCRLSCGVCWENKTIYTGCFQCNGNYICSTCYFNLENENECPFCRHDGMIIGIECLSILEDNDFANWKEKMYFVLNVLNKNK